MMKKFSSAVMFLALLPMLPNKIYAADDAPHTGDNTNIIFAAIVILTIALFIFIRRRTSRK